jgi:tRNA (guanine-N1)-methyltransferase
MLNFTLVTLFPAMFESPLNHSILKKAQGKGLISIILVNPREKLIEWRRREVKGVVNTKGFIK